LTFARRGTAKRIALSVAVAASLVVGSAQTVEELTNPAPDEWPTFGRTLDNHRFSPLDQVNKETVSDLRLNWSISLESAIDAQFSPVVYDGVMYLPAADGATAVDAATGDRLWVYQVDLAPNTPPFTAGRMRGGLVVFDGKVFGTTGDGRVFALDASNGAELWSTAVGTLDLSEGFSAGPIFADGKIIVGPAGADMGGVNGRVVALDSESGEILWTFNTVPAPGEPGFETWNPPTAAQYGGASAWTPGVYDPVTRTVIYGTGNAIPWWAGAHREGDNLYVASYVALDIDTGALKWYHQAVPREEWDIDTINTPVVADLTIDGQERRVAILALVTGYVVWVDADTGELLQWEGYNPEFTIHLGYDENGKSIINDDMRWTEETAGEVHLVCPLRWVDYEPAALDPERGIYFRPNTHECYEMANNPPPAGWQPGESAINAALTPLPDRFDRLGGLTAINAATGEVVWDFPVDGYSQRSGVVATAGGLVFMGSADRVFRAFDSDTGEVLWQQRLPAYIAGNPISYSVDGKQYVAVPVGGAGNIMIARQTGAPELVTSEVMVFVFSLP
jgi:PQQ-dependent dehydrogenase (methanol/ethanol family)